MSLRRRTVAAFLVFTFVPLALIVIFDHIQTPNMLIGSFEERIQDSTDRLSILLEEELQVRSASLHTIAEGLGQDRGGEWGLDVMVAEASPRLFDRMEVREVDAVRAAVDVSGPGGVDLPCLPGAGPGEVAVPVPGATDLWLVGLTSPGRLVDGLRARGGLPGPGETLYIYDRSTGVVGWSSGGCEPVGQDVSRLLRAPRRGHPAVVVSDLDATMGRWGFVLAADVSDVLGPFVRSSRTHLLAGLGLLLAAGLLGASWIRRTFRPLERLAVVAEEIGEGRATPWLPFPGEDEVGRLSLALARVTYRLADSVRQIDSSLRLGRMGEHVAYLSHEIRNPLGAIRINLQSVRRELQQGSFPEDLPSVLDSSVEEVDRLDRMLTAALRTAGAPGTAETGCRAHAVLGEVVELLDPICRAEDIYIDAGLGAADDRVRVGAEALKGVLINLVLNSREAMSGGGRVRITTAAGRDAGGVPCLHVDVVDEGPGVPRHHRQRIFEPFWTTRNDGNGIGLAFCRATLRAWGGELELMPGGGWSVGAHFRVSLPVLGQVEDDRSSDGTATGIATCAGPSAPASPEVQVG